MLGFASLNPTYEPASNTSYESTGLMKLRS